ncbi:MAG TPA: hypothetical protein VMV77_19630 [Bacteroidales bacterium]|nr:hypothetical protein [Bacteroidales bacterium]
MVVDGSDRENYKRLSKFDSRYNVSIHHFNYNIHHGPGMAYGIKTITTDQILLIDSDVRVLRGGFIEDLQSKLLLKSYGIGSVSQVNERGVSIVSKGIKYLHPALALINRNIALQFPLPTKHGAPMFEPMEMIRDKKKQYLLQNEPWIEDDLVHSYVDRINTINRHFIVHEWSGTVSRTGGIHL